MPDYRTNRDLFSNHYLDEQLPETEAWNAVDETELCATRDEIRELWEDARALAPTQNEAQLEERFVRPTFRALGIPFEVEETTSRTQRRPDYAFFESEAVADDAFTRRDEGGNFYENAVAVADAKRWGRSLDTRGSGEHERDFENPSYRIHVSLQETPTRWGVLTDGRRWRLYYGPTSHRLDSYYEVDLEALLEEDDLESFRYFYCFFRHEAFRGAADGECFLDEVYDGSIAFARELGEDLQDNVYEAIEVLAEGFIRHPDNDLGEDDLELIHDSALVYLYRLIFVLYAESEGRDLLDTGNEIYRESFSLTALKREVAAELDRGDPSYRRWQDDLWSRLEELFALVDRGSEARGIPQEDLSIPAYNGGLFRTDPDEDDDVESRFLAEHPVGDAAMAEVIDLLTRSRNGDGRTFVDYSSLDVRHLGSIYEGLLEYDLELADEALTIDDGEYCPAGEGDEVAVEAGSPYLATHSGERKETGSYYTPEYVVEYVLDEALGPLVQGIREDLSDRDALGEVGHADEFAERIFELNVLDPAMGSGHFLTGAVDYLAREIVDAQERQAVQQGVDTVDEDRDVNWARRTVAQRCIYGVDRNPLATELATVSLWLRTLAANQPLAFLDHHLKAGDSLVGSDVETVFDDDTEPEGGQLTLQQSFAHTRRRALGHVMDRFRDLLAIDNETLADAKAMEDAYDEVRGDPLYRRLLAMADVHTAEAYGVDVPDDAHERMAEALRDDSWAEIEGQEWFQAARSLADDEQFFHWDLEFPVAFYDDDGQRRDGGGFDAVVGNPPYVSAWNRDLNQDEFFRGRYHAASGHYDLYGLFVERGADLLGPSGRMSMIVPDTLCGQAYAANAREILATETSLETVLDLRDRVVFEDASVDNVVVTVRGTPGELDEVRIERIVPGADHEFEFSHAVPYELLSAEDDYRIPLSAGGFDLGLREKLSTGIELGEAFYVSKGMEPHTADGGSKYEFIEKTEPEEGVESGAGVESEERAEPGDSMEAYVEGKHVDLWRIGSNWWIDYSPGEHKAPAFRRLFEARKIVGARTIGEGRPEFAVDERGFYDNEKVLNAVPYDELTRASETHSQVTVTEENLEYGELFSPYAVVAVLNSAVTAFWFREIESGALDFFPRHLEKVRLPVPETAPDYDGAEGEPAVGSGSSISSTSGIEDAGSSTSDAPVARIYASLHREARRATNLHDRRANLNVDLLDYLGAYVEGPALPDLGLFQSAGPSILDATTEEYDTLRIGSVRAERDGTSVAISATVRYKPDDDGGLETDRWGYTETEYHDAFALVELSEADAALVEAFVPVAVEEGDGFAGFRETATKTISPLDRLKSITLPDLDDVEDDLRRYVETRERADQLDAEIERTERRIDDLVYGLYGLTEEEIAIVESAVE